MIAEGLDPAVLDGGSGAGGGGKVEEKSEKPLEADTLFSAEVREKMKIKPGQKMKALHWSRVDENLKFDPVQTKPRDLFYVRSRLDPL